MRGIWVTLVLALAIALIASPVYAQEPTETPSPTPEPTATPTPAYMQDVPLSSGNVLHVERSITYGDAAIVVIVALDIIVTLLSMAIQIPKRFMQR